MSQALPGVQVSMACAFCCRSLLEKACSGLVWVSFALAGCQHKLVCKCNLCGNQVVVLSRTFAELVFLRENAPKLSHPWVLERCFQPSDPTKVGLTGSLLRGHCCVSPCCTTSSAMVMGTGTNAALAPGTSYLRLLRSCCVH